MNGWVQAVALVALLVVGAVVWHRFERWVWGHLLAVSGGALSLLALAVLVASWVGGLRRRPPHEDG